MNAVWSEVENTIDLLNNIWIGLVVIAAATAPTYFSHKNSKTLNEVKHQVQNAHSTNLRDDLDRAISAIEALAHDVTALRHDLHAERDSRKSQVDDLRSDVDRMRRRP